ncbi:MAG: hypothetical protein LHW45_09325 [Candidatus Cloacimonetes bacterium]|nr:hypothetical protein [Candidatus Cloacimonadota bacterium]MDY0367811.1 hypothetical protein [Candidatus Syntrophosphaera sp.]
MPAKIKYLVTLLLLLACGASLAAEGTGLQLVQSLVLPGLSQVRHGRNYGYGMLTAEAALISSLLYLNEEAQLKTQEYYEYALKYAHITPGDHADSYLRDLSKFNSSGYEAGGYNAWVRQEALRLFPQDPAQQQIYIDENIYLDDQAWNWDSVDNRGQYVQIRTEAQNMRDYRMLAVGVMIVNHLISGIDVLRYNAKDNKAQVWLDIKDRSPMLMLGLEF